MTPKRKTKAQREAELKAALLQRLTDIYSGACGKKWDSAVDGDFATAEILGHVVPAVKAIFGDRVGDYAFAGLCLRYFDTPESAADHLMREGALP